MDILAAADRFVTRTGLYRMTMIDRPRPRSLRWLPLVVLALLWGGLRMMPLGAHRSWIVAGFLGPLLFFGAYSGSVYLRFFGPRLDADPRHPLDERERALRARAFAWSGTVFTLAACFGCLYMGIAETWRWPRPSGLTEWVYLGMAMQGTAQLLPVLFASWLGPRIAADDL